MNFISVSWLKKLFNAKQEVKKRRSRLTEEEVGYIVALYDKGFSVNRIAIDVDCSRTTVYKKTRHLRIDNGE